MRVETKSYRFAREIAEHPHFMNAWNEIHTILAAAPIFVYPGKSSKKKDLDVVQQVMNTYFDILFAIGHGWTYHPLATRIADSSLTADLRKQFGELTIQTEIQFGNMSRWYSDIFKFQTAYSQGLVQMGLSVVPMYELAKRIGENIVNFERCWRELPSAELSITLPILLVGLGLDEQTVVVDISECRFANIKEIIGKGKADNIVRIVHGYIRGIPMREIGQDSPPGPTPGPPSQEDEEPEELQS